MTDDTNMAEIPLFACGYDAIPLAGLEMPTSPTTPSVYGAACPRLHFPYTRTTVTEPPMLEHLACARCVVRAEISKSSGRSAADYDMVCLFCAETFAPCVDVATIAISI